VNPPYGAFEYLLLNGRLAIIFDGLDELLDTSYRQEVTKDIESFCNLFPSTPVIVTSREVGYEQAPLDSRFSVYRLAPFDEKQIHEYSHKWFSTVSELPLEQRQQRANSFLRESRTAPDLRSNPLMLALMCNIYRGENYIPRNRPDLHEKCALMLFERWDKSRGIKALLPFEAHISPAMKFLAHWIYSDEKLQGGVTERQLIAKATEYLVDRRFEDRSEAEKAANDFINFCRGRAWVFTDMGTTREGDSLYQFTHRTFLEYFTASHIIRHHPTPEKLFKTLQPRIRRREWDVVAQLAFQLQNKNVEGAADVLLMSLVNQAKRQQSLENWNILLFAARCLGFMVPSPRIVRALSDTILGRYFSLLVTANHVVMEPAIEAVSALLYVATENQLLIINILEQFIQKKVDSGTPDEQIITLEFACNLPTFIYQKGDSEYLQIHEAEAWKKVSDRLLGMHLGLACTLAERSPGLACDMFWRGHMEIEKFISSHGVSSLFSAINYIILPGVRRSAIYVGLFNAPVKQASTQQDSTSDSPSWVQVAMHELSRLGRMLSDGTLGWWLPRCDMDQLYWFDSPSDKDKKDIRARDFPLTLDPERTIALFVLAASAFECTDEQQKFADEFKRNNVLKPVSSLLLARLEPERQVQLPSELESLGFTDTQKKLISNWALGSNNFVRGQDVTAS